MDKGLESPGAMCNGIIVQDKGSGVRCRFLNGDQGNQGNDMLNDEGGDNSVPLVDGEHRPPNQQGAEYISPNTTGGTVDTVVDSNVDNIVEAPKLGMVFNSWLDVELFYKEYAEAIGFGVSRVQGAYSKGEERVRISTTWRCECYGKPDMRAQREAKKRAKAMDMSGSGGVVGGVVLEDNLSHSKRRSKKCDCKAMVYASVNRDAQWEIKRVELEHSNHIPSPALARLVKEYRMKQLTPMARKQLITFFDRGVPVSQIHSCMGIEDDETGSVALTVKDLQHEVYKSRRAKMECGDSVAMMSFFNKMQARDVNFYHTQRLDQEGRLKDVLWVDARSRAAFEEFGDVVCFDGTYLTNEYDLPFLNFVGVNHHGQSILLGCALVSHEDCDTFRWVFKHWLECMKNKAPKSILTDQAAAMRKPLEEVMPNTRHRWCIWHIMRKIPEKLGKCERYKDFKGLLKRIVYESFTIQEFESRWCEFLETFELQTNEWLSSIYKERHMWIPAFMKEFFWAGMKTTQRVESINSFFDGFLTRNTKLFEFPMKYENALKKRIRDEVDADAKGSKYIRRLVSGFPVEKMFQKIYTDTKFQEVQNECSRMMYCVPRQEFEVTDTLIQYVIEDRVWVVPDGKSEDVLTDRRRLYSATFNKDTNVVCCDCRKFETDGIICRHTIRILDLNHVKDIPERYIVSRWRKDLLRKHTRIHSSYHDSTKTAEVKRFRHLMSAFEPICEEAAMVDDVTVQMVVESLEEIKSKVNGCRKRKLEQTVPIVHAGDGSPTVHHSLGTNENTPNVAHPSESAEGFMEEGGVNQNAIRDPVPKKRGRGRPKSTRYKGLLEIGFKKPTKNLPSKKKKSSGVNLAIPPTMVGDVVKGATKSKKHHSNKLGSDNPVTPRPKGKTFATKPTNTPTQKKQKTVCVNLIGNSKTVEEPATNPGQPPRSKQQRITRSKPCIPAKLGKTSTKNTNMFPVQLASQKREKSRNLGNVSTHTSRTGKRKTIDGHPRKKRCEGSGYLATAHTLTEIPLNTKVSQTQASTRGDCVDNVDSLLRDLTPEVTTPSRRLDWLYEDDSLLVDCSIDLSETIADTLGSLPSKHAPSKVSNTPSIFKSFAVDDEDSLINISTGNSGSF